MGAKTKIRRAVHDENSAWRAKIKIWRGKCEKLGVRFQKFQDRWRTNTSTLQTGTLVTTQ